MRQDPLDEDAQALLRELRRHEGWVRVADLATALGWREYDHRVGRMRARTAACRLDAAGVAVMRRVGGGYYEIRLSAGNE